MMKNAIANDDKTIGSIDNAILLRLRREGAVSVFVGIQGLFELTFESPAKLVIDCFDNAIIIVNCTFLFSRIIMNSRKTSDPNP